MNYLGRVNATPQDEHFIWKHGTPRWCGKVFPQRGQTH